MPMTAHLLSSLKKDTEFSMISADAKWLGLVAQEVGEQNQRTPYYNAKHPSSFPHLPRALFQYTAHFITARNITFSITTLKLRVRSR
jgi:hypothetical protein